MTNANPENIRLLSMIEMEEEYRTFARQSQDRAINLGDWMPELGKRIRPLMPGELAVIMSDTGVGKTAMAQNIARAVYPQITFLFELELPATLCFERFASMELGMHGETIERYCRLGRKLGNEYKLGNMAHIYTCDDSRMSVDMIADVIEYQRQQMRIDPELVIVDYIGLLGGDRNKSRHERITNAAQDLKRLAKQCNVVVIATTQIHRKGDDFADQVTIHDARDSGAVEESAGVVMGAWRDQDDRNQLMLKVLKSTKDGSSDVIKCVFDGPTMQIKPSASYVEQWVPEELPTSEEI